MLTKGDDPAAEEPEPPAEIPSAEDDVTAAQAARVATMEPAAPTSPTSSVTQKLADDAGDPQPAAPTSPASLSLESAQVDGDPRPDPHEYPQHLRLPLTLAYCSIVAFNVAFCMGLRGPALLRIAEQIDLISLPADGGSAAEVDLSQLTEMGVANMAFTGTSAVFSVFITGAVVDRMPKFHYLTFTMCMLLAFLSLSVIWIDSAWQLIFICALMGVCLSAIMPLLAALMWVFKENVAPAMHAFNASFGIGMLLAPLLVSWDVAENDTFHNAYIGCAAVAAVVSIPIILLPSPHNPESKQCCGGSDEDQAAGDPKGGAEAEASASDDSKYRMLWLAIYIYGPSEVCAENVFGVWISSYVELTGLATAELAPVFQTVYYTCFTLSRFAAVPISSRISSAMVIAIFLPLALLSSIGLIIATKIESVALVWVCVGLFGVAVGPIGVPAVMSLLAEYGIYPSATRMGFTMGMNMLGDVFGNLLVGMLFSGGEGGVEASMWVYVFNCVTMVVSVLVLRFFILPGLETTAAAAATVTKTAP